MMLMSAPRVSLKCRVSYLFHNTSVELGLLQL
ncbi:hypothetical protein E2C01_053457 [Portunus trituberculatus]|uniref:Uncharacterized protein n=1 Tax=Portunus trituberculatus TaxID=210409 RepID=A0A5B7GQU8_PORTR|nr:hypothetical protein [Portunus trituberculatus]